MPLMEYQSTIKRDELPINITPWMNLRNVSLSEKSPIQKKACCMIPFYEMSKQGKVIETENSYMFVNGWIWD